MFSRLSSSTGLFSTLLHAILSLSLSLSLSPEMALSLLLLFFVLVVVVWVAWRSSKGPGCFIESLLGKHVFITGGSSGIGLAIAKTCLEQGAYVTLLARNWDRLVDAQSSLLQSVGCPPERIVIKAVDVSHATEVCEATKEAFQQRPIDVLICNAGITTMSTFAEADVSTLKQVFDVNLMGSVYPLQAALPLMKQRSLSHPSSIVFINSVSGLAFCCFTNVYSSTKYAQRGLAESLRVELRSHNIKVTLSCPFFTETPMLDTSDAVDEKRIELFEHLHQYKREKAQSAEEVAIATVEGFKRGEYIVTPNLYGYFSGVLSRGMLPANSFARNALEILCLVTFRIFSYVKAWDMHRVLLHPDSFDLF